MIRGFKTISHEAALALSGLPHVIGRIHERVQSYAAKHQDHYSEHIPNSHIEYTLGIGETYEVDVGKYESPSSPQYP